ncbi:MULTISPECIES: recombinase family protein [Clostridium]|uniref:recombinase family protein n=1 Tax=Clostridium TaxID=1485 RepID=UPI00082536C2|nr:MULTISPECIES: recombinase family protein [Clostridium]PJI06602.1 recombinase family protein [Clostridium sp. CT7]
MKKVALYCRVSSDDQKERGTIENQIETLVSYIKYIKTNKDIDIYGQYLDDGVSGAIEFVNRPAGSKLVKDASDGLFNIVLVWKIDRFGRDTLTGLKTVESLRKYNVEIMSMTEPFDLNTPAGRFQFITYLNMAELERNNILDRLFLGATIAAKKGKWMGGIVPYGYEKNNDGFLEINNNEAKIIREIFDMYTNKRFSTIDIAVYLNNLGIPSSCGKGKGKRTKKVSGKWRCSSIDRILNSTTYKGIHEYGKRATRRKKTIIRKVPAIVSEEIWNKAQIVKEKNKLISKRNIKRRQYLLRGLISCGICGYNYYGISYTNKSSVYACRGKLGKENKKILNIKCNNLNINANLLENEVWQTCLDILKNYNKYIKHLKQKSSNNNNDNIKNALDKLNSNLANKNSEKEKILSLFRKNIINEEDVKNQLLDIQEEEKKLLNLINNLKTNKRHNNNENKLIHNMSDKLEYYKSKLDKLEFQDKYDIVHILVKKITIDTTIKYGQKVPKATIKYNLVSPLVNDCQSVKFSNCTDVLAVTMARIENVPVQNIKGKDIYQNYQVPLLIE